jgi:hypothetical protein
LSINHHGVTSGKSNTESKSMIQQQTLVAPVVPVLWDSICFTLSYCEGST